MRATRWLLSAVIPAIALAVFALGCGDKSPTTAPQPDAPITTLKDIEFDGYAKAITGRVTYKGAAEPTLKEIKPTKDESACPPVVPTEGWYVKDSTDKKGVQFAVVFLVPDGGRFPAKEFQKLPAGMAEFFEIDQPKCSFEPRVAVLHPAQKLRIWNRSDPPVTHGSNIGGANTVTSNLAPGKNVESPIRPSDTQVNSISCGQHDWMKGYVWKFTHGYAAVTDKEGNYTIPNVGIPKDKNVKYRLVVWHEMLPGNKRKEIGTVEGKLKANEELKMDFTLPD